MTAWSPLRYPVFRMLWLSWLAANLSIFMSDVAAAWLMTSLVTSPVMVALVQTASTLPVPSASRGRTICAASIA